MNAHSPSSGFVSGTGNPSSDNPRGVLLREWQKERLVMLRGRSFPSSRYEGEVTLLIYSFPMTGVETEAFQWIESAVLQTWSVIGMLKTVLVVNRPFPEAITFSRRYPQVEIQVEESIKPGQLVTMSWDCIYRLHTRFPTPNVLIIQDDGFPLRDTLADFLGKWDYIGAPIVSTGWKRTLLYAFRLATYNGGFSLRAKRYCEYAAHSWDSVWRHFLTTRSGIFAEDVYYSTTLRLLPVTHFRFRFPSEKEAFKFSVDNLDGAVTLPENVLPFGFHGKSTGDLLIGSGDSAP